MILSLPYVGKKKKKVKSISWAYLIRFFSVFSSKSPTLKRISEISFDLKCIKFVGIFIFSYCTMENRMASFFIYIKTVVYFFFFKKKNC